MLTKMDEGAWLEFSRQIRESIEAVDIIKSDCDRCEEELKRDSSDQFFRRALIRNICAYVEAFLYTMSRGPRHICALAKEERIIAKTVQRTFGCTISDENLRLLDDEKGSRLSFKERFKRVIQIFDQVYRFAGQ